MFAQRTETVVELAASHSSMLSRPKDVAEIITQTAVQPA